MPGRGPRHHAQPLDVEPRRKRRHHLDRTARQPERHRPDRRLPRPVEKAVRHRGDDEAAGKAVNALGDALEERGVFVVIGPLLAELFPFLEILEASPDGGRYFRNWRFHTTATRECAPGT